MCPNGATCLPADCCFSQGKSRLLILKMYSLIGRYLRKRFCYPISIFLTTACNTSSCFMSIPRCFPFRDILFVLNFIHLPVVNFKSQVNKRIALKYYLGEPHFCFCFCDDYYSGKKNITNFGFINIIKQLMTLDFS